jgi:hypothetical protein
MHNLPVLLDRHALAIGLLLLGAAAIAPVYVYLHYPAAGDPEYPQFTTAIYSPSPPAAYACVGPGKRRWIGLLRCVYAALKELPESPSRSDFLARI